jgi:hypothetical protein
MTFRINDFSSKLIGGGARPTLFNVDLGTKFDPTLNLISAFMVQSTSLPASSIAPIELPYMGRKMRVAGDRTFDTWSVTVINDEDFRIRHAMESWMNRINSLEGNLMDTDGTSNPSSYKHDASVKQYGKSAKSTEGGDILREYKFFKMFPIAISAIDLDWNATDEVERFTVDFSYDYYELVDSKPLR